MGNLVAAYRRHPHHGVPISQEIVGQWAGVSQGQISRMESGPPERHIDRLVYWARLLSIPADVLWFTAPAATSPEIDAFPFPMGRPEILATRAESPGDDPILAEGDSAVASPFDDRAGVADVWANEVEVTDVDLIEFALVLDRHGISSSKLTAVELACERLDQDFARTSPDQVLATTQVLMRRVSIHLRQPQTLRHHERLVRVAARLAGLRAWACFDLDDHREAERWYEAAVTAAHDAKAWGLGAWLLGAQSLIPWHRRDLRHTAELIDRGIYFAGQGSDATTRAWLYALQARACAGMDNKAGFETSYAMAEEVAEYSTERDRRHGMDFAHGTLDLRYYCGTSQLLLRQPQQAVPELTGSLTALPESHTKARAVLTLFLADAALQSGDTTQAIDLAQDALTSTIHQPIVPILQHSRRIRRLVRQRDPAAGEKLNEPVQAFSDALTAIAAKAKS